MQVPFKGNSIMELWLAKSFSRAFARGLVTNGVMCYNCTNIGYTEKWMQDDKMRFLKKNLFRVVII